VYGAKYGAGKKYIGKKINLIKFNF